MASNVSMVLTTLGHNKKALDTDNDVRQALFLKMQLGDEARQHIKTSSPAAVTAALSSSYSLHLSRYMAQNAPKSAFNTMKANMVEVPLRTRVVAQTTVLGAGVEVDEGQPKRIRRLNVTNLDTELDKFAASCAITQEFADMAPELAARVLNDWLADAVARGVDGFFLGKLNAVSSEESDSDVNPTFQQMLDDLGELLRRVQTGEKSRLYFIMQSRAAKYLATQAYSAGVTSVKYNGGEIMEAQIVVSDSQSSGVVTVADASAIVYGSDGLQVRSSDVAAIELLDNPTNASGPSVTATQLVSCMQAGFRAIIAEESIAIRVADTSAVASLTGVQWGIGEGSPQA